MDQALFFSFYLDILAISHKRLMHFTAYFVNTAADSSRATQKLLCTCGACSWKKWLRFLCAESAQKPQPFCNYSGTGSATN